MESQAQAHISLRRSGLIGAGAAITGLDLTSRARVLLQTAPIGGTGSDLNPNGTPLQLLLSARRDRWVLRIVGDPGFDRTDPIARWEASRAALTQAVALGDATSLLAVIELTLALLVPLDTLVCRPNGAIRLALPVAGPGVALYVGVAPGWDGWSVTRDWLSMLLLQPEVARGHIDRLTPHCTLFGVGLEGTSPERLRFKLYWRLARPTRLGALGVPLLARSEMIHFLADLLGPSELPIDALTLCIAFDATSGELCDAKVDVCAASARLGNAAALTLVNRHAAALSLTPPPLSGLQALLAERNIAVACLGLGVDRRGEHRLNTYLCEDP